MYDAVARGSRRFTLGHTWDGAPLPCAVGLAVLGALKSEGLVDHVRERGSRLRDELEDALQGVDLVGEVRGRGFLLGVEYVDPRDGSSFLPPGLGVAGRIDRAAMELGLITLSTMPTRDGFAGDQTLFALPLTTSDAELSQMVERFAETVRWVARSIEPELERRSAAAHRGEDR